MATGVTLKNSEVNGGVAVNLQDVGITFGMVKLASAHPVPSSSNIAEVDQIGFGTPLYTLRGFIDMDDVPDPNTGSGATITEGYLKQFLKADTTNTTLTITTGNVNETKFTAFDGTTTDIIVVIKDVTIKMGTDSEKAHLHQYSILLWEST